MFNKKIALVLAAVTTALALAACGGQDVSAPASVSTSQSVSSARQTTESKAKESASAAQDKSAASGSEKNTSSSAAKSAASGSTKAADTKAATDKSGSGTTTGGTTTGNNTTGNNTTGNTTGGNTTGSNTTGSTGNSQADTGKTDTSAGDKTPAATPTPGGIVEGGLDNVIPGGGITDQDGGNAEFVERPDPAPAPSEDSGNLVTNGGNGNDIISGAPERNPDGTWEGDGGNATPGDQVIPPEPVA